MICAFYGVKLKNVPLPEPLTVMDAVPEGSSLTVINPNKDYTAPFLLPKDSGAMIIAGYSKVEIYISAFYSHTVTCYDATGSSLGSFSDGTLQTWHDIKGQRV